MEQKEKLQHEFTPIFVYVFDEESKTYMEKCGYKSMPHNPDIGEWCYLVDAELLGEIKNDIGSHKVLCTDISYF